jgi:hypothetical protein
MPNDSEWQSLAAQGHAVEAIRAYCVAHGVGLAEAKAAVERWRAVNYPPSPAFQRAFRAARRLTDALLAYLADPKDAAGQNTRFFSDVQPDRPTLDLAVEVAMEGVSEGLRRETAGRHAADGVRLVWFLCPETRTVVVQAGGKLAELDEHATLDGGDVLPGFSCEVAELFN